MRLVLGLLVAGTLAGCSIGNPGAAVSSGSTSSAGVASGAGSVLANATAASGRTLAPAPSETPELGTAERSDLFWSPVTHQGAYSYSFATLSEITQQVDLVVRGHISSASLGRSVDAHPEIGGPPVSFVIVTIMLDEVLRGIVETESEGSVKLELFLPNAAAWDAMMVNVPSHDHLFFLINIGLEEERLGKPVQAQEAGRFLYVPAKDQAVVRSIEGMVRGIEPDGSDRFPAGLEGDAFSDVVDRVRDIAEEMANS